MSYVLRLRVDDLLSGRLVGVVEDVRSGEHHGISGVDELVAFCAAHAEAPATRSDAGVGDAPG